jgi:hypothetical protein
MTACAMTVGMVPMALALEKGSQMQAPLGRAVIGGLVMSTFATLLVLPPLFALVIGRSTARSPSVYPDDPDSAHYDPLVYAQVDELDKSIVPSEDYAAWPAHVDADAAEVGATAAHPRSSLQTGQSESDHIIEARRIGQPRPTDPKANEPTGPSEGGPELGNGSDKPSQTPPSAGDS